MAEEDDELHDYRGRGSGASTSLWVEGVSAVADGRATRFRGRGR